MNKYRNRPPELPLKGVYFKSQAERNHALWLESEKQAGRVAHWQYEMSYDLKANGKLVSKHKPDFTVTLPNGVVEVNEVKGGLATQTDAWRLRRKLFVANFPHIKYKVFDGRKRWKRQSNF